jgi:multiple sugar transport system ATP-binding protein
VLPIGSDQYLGLEIEGEELFFRVGKDRRYMTGDSIALAADVGRLHVFDPESGQSLLGSRCELP